MAHVNILILQHPNERAKYYSTAKLVQGAVINSQLLRGVEFEQEVVERVLAGRNARLLFPGPDALDCEKVPLDENATVVVIDGTWSEAGKIVRRNPVLASLPRISFARPLRSEYRIRRQPKEFCLSTVESVGHFLRLNAAALGRPEMNTRYETLFSAFRRMVDQQLGYWGRNPVVRVSALAEPSSPSSRAECEKVG